MNTDNKQKILDEFDFIIKPIYTKEFTIKVKKFKVEKFEPRINL